MREASESAFQNRIDFPLTDLNNSLVLDIGCGMGRYVEVAAKVGANVTGVDLSFAIDAAFENVGRKPNVHLIQADIFNLPFLPETFDFIYSFGVLHHTPDAASAFKQLPKLLKKNGKISISVYSSYNRGIIYTSALWRLFTTRIPKRLLYLLCYISVPLYFMYKIPIICHIGRMLFVIPMIPHWKWRVLDTFDWYSPKYQSKHTHWEVYKWFKDNGLKDIAIYPNEVTMSAVKGE
jgi:SAM-dependent methyltransferase